MHLFYDGGIFALQSMGGINRYFAQLIAHLPEDYTIELTTTTINSLSYPEHKKLTTHQYARFGFRPGRISYWMEGRSFRYVLSKSAAQIIHPTYYSLLTQESPKRLKLPVVATIFDLVHERYPALTDRDGAIRKAKKALVDRADIIICLSNHTKSDIVKWYGIPASRVQVTYPGPSLAAPQVVHRQEVQRPYFLFVGNRWSYKNFPLFLKAFVAVKSRNPELCAIVVGPLLTPQERTLVYELGLRASVQDVGYLSDEDLGLVYRDAVGLVYPSDLEGFGFPVLEAMTCGTPIITTAAASIPEVVGDAGLVVSTDHRDELIAAMERLIGCEGVGDSYRSRGRLRASQFSWRECAARTVSLYESVAT